MKKNEKINYLFSSLNYIKEELGHPHPYPCVSHAHMLTCTDTIQFHEPSTLIAFINFWRSHGRVSTFKGLINQNLGTIGTKCDKYVCS